MRLLEIFKQGIYELSLHSTHANLSNNEQVISTLPLSISVVPINSSILNPHILFLVVVLVLNSFDNVNGFGGLFVVTASKDKVDENVL